jgi:hypothetical protein
MYSGLALLLDVYHPEESNGYGSVHISGSGWSAPLSPDARPLKEAGHVACEVYPLAKAGYTMFTINHRAAPVSVIRILFWIASVPFAGSAQTRRITK